MVTGRRANQVEGRSTSVEATAGRERRHRLRLWARSKGRDFPWRQSEDPWALLVAEMLLRRTRAAQVADHLPGILSKFPTPGSMVKAHPATVDAALRPLGLKWRARNIRQAARVLLDEFAGAVPCDPEALKQLPGVGPYVAGAVAASLSRRPALLIDVNTVRVATRVAGIDPQGDVRRRKDVVRAVEGLLGGAALAPDWWAVLDLAALVCRAGTPHCSECPLIELCKYGETEGSETRV